jgi:MFS family permease
MSEIGRDRRGAWRAALACMVTLSVAMGLGRFAFTPMLPIMLHEGKLELAAGGLLASLNYLGYFVGAVSCAAIGIKASSMVRGGLLATAALLVGMGLLHSFTSWGVLRTAAGVMSAWVFVFASGWGLRRLAETNSPTLAGVIYTGPGIGIAMTGLLGGALGRWGSEAGWIGLGLLALVLIAVIWRVFDDAERAPVGGAWARPVATARSGTSAADRSDAIWLVALYGLAGFGYIITATFLPVIARQALPDSPWPDLFWPLFGLAIIPGALIGARAPTHWDNRLLLAGGLRAAGAGRGAVGGLAHHWRLRAWEPAAGHAVHRDHSFCDAGRAAAARQCGGGVDRLCDGVVWGRADHRAALCGTAGPADGVFSAAVAGCRNCIGARCGLICIGLGEISPFNGALSVEAPSFITRIAYNSRLTTKRAGTNRPFFLVCAF